MGAGGVQRVFLVFFFAFSFQVPKALGRGFLCKFSPWFGGCLQVLKGLGGGGGGGFLCNPPPPQLFFWGGGFSLSFTIQKGW